MHADMSAHGHHANMNLFEGNSTNRAHVDTYWGSNANFIFLRNKMICPDGYQRSHDPASLDKNNPYMSFVGNILHHENSLEDRLVWDFPDEPDDFSDPEWTLSTLICHGNFDYMSENTIWDPELLSKDIPNSFYLDAKPDFFMNAPWGDTPWPVIGPDLLHAGLIPAQQRFCDLNGLTPPTAPTGLSATASDDQILLSWTDNSSNEQGFRIEQSLDGLSFDRIAVTQPDENSYTMIGLSPFTPYTFRVCSYLDETGNSDFSNTSSATTGAASSTELTASYPFDGNANDATVNGYDGVVTGATLTSGLIGQAYEFNGTSDYIAVPSWDGPIDGDESPFTITAWINPHNTEINNWVLSDDSPWGNFVFGLEKDRPFVKWFCNLEGGGYTRYELTSVETAVVRANQFSHIGATYDPINDIARLYLNGEQVAIDRVSDPWGSGGFNQCFIGRGSIQGTLEYFDGVIDEIQIYHATLSSQRIKEIYEGDLSLPVQGIEMMATQTNGGTVTVEWMTQSELNCRGFHVWRSTERNADYARITTELIPGQGTTSNAHEYYYVDNQVQQGIVFWYKIEEISTSGRSIFHGPVQCICSNIPEDFHLSQNYPNPFNPETTIAFDVKESCDVSLVLYDLLGRQVAVLIQEKYHPGSFEFSFDASHLSAGIYFYRIQMGTYQSVRKMVVLK